MKIVKFKDGRYGVRKWDWGELSYVFYLLRNDNCLGRGRHLGGFWIAMDSFWESNIKHETHASALELYREVTANDNYANNLKDTGTPIKEQI
jgi:hypothetical protein